jgi:hypothetical protein
MAFSVLVYSAHSAGATGAKAQYLLHLNAGLKARSSTSIRDTATLEML